MTVDQLNDLLYNESRFDALIDSLPQIRSLPTEREAGLAQNKSLAEWNLAQEPKLNQLRLQVKALHEQATTLRSEVESLKAKLDEISSSKSLDTTSNLLQVAAQEADDEAEATIKAFLAGTIPAEQFLKDLLEKKTLAHLRFGLECMLAKCRPLCSTIYRRFASLREMAGPQDPELLYEPKFPDTREYPEYDLLNVRIQGYDFTYIEKFQGYVDRMARRFKFNVVDSYAVAAQTQRVVVYKPNSTIVDNELKLSLYDRVVRLSNVPAPQLQLFISLIQTHLPVGVTISRASSLVVTSVRSCRIAAMASEVVEKLVPYELVDIGANLGHPSFKKDLDDVLKRARQAGIAKLMITGTCEKISKEAMKLAETMPGFLYFTAGVHPHDAKDFNDDTMDTLRELQSVLVARTVCSCGRVWSGFQQKFLASRHPERSVYEAGIEGDVYSRQCLDGQCCSIFWVELACELQKPLFIHEREAHEDMVRILSSAGERLPPAVLHCFTGTEDEAKKYVDMGFYIGLTGFMWKDRLPNGVQAALRNGSIPLNRLLIETDAPFMYPKINDKKLPADIREAITDSTKELHKFASFNRNEPCALAAVCEMIAAFMGKDPKEACRFKDLPPFNAFVSFEFCSRPAVGKTTGAC
ncbi:unnamed protein product [Heligmosomoides polygyrus]|uniref:Deoxyribonuclease TATDN1 n=1 Tax=Heligmosomoides polygyrus TaxID=6339 RepID=A0A3P8CY37_HELPZ|nr:unnamed protein product [Heligmosomoides polygyrus]